VSPESRQHVLDEGADVATCALRLERLRAAVEQIAGVVGSYRANPLADELAALLREVLEVDAAGGDPTSLG
jgi:hypothetical protein